MKYKLFVSDFDGTIFRDNHTVSQKTIDTFAQYISIGGNVAIATGRLYSSIAPQLKLMNLDGTVIVYQGAGIYDIKSGQRVYHMPLEHSLAVDVLKHLQANEDCVPMMFFDDTCFIQQHNEATKYFAKIVGVDQVELKMPLCEYVQKNNILPSKILALTYENLSLGIAEDLRKVFGQKININRSSSMLVEIVNPLASKGVAIEWLRQKLNIKREEIIAIGDAENDISMIKYAGLGVAVENAMQTLKDVADTIAPSNDNDGVADTIIKYCLQDKEV